MVRFAPRGYYAILDVKGAVPPSDAELLRRARGLLDAGPCCLQVRGKGLSAAALRNTARALAPLCRSAGIPLCVNDRFDVALAVGAEVVHLGQEDLPLADALRLRGDRSLAVGISTHDFAQARAAAAGGADYLGFGPVFATRSKDRPDPMVGLDALASVCAAVSLPIVAIGGVTPENVADVVRAGAAAVAVIAAVESAADPTTAGRRLGAAFSHA